MVTTQTKTRRPTDAEVRQIWRRWKETGDARERDRLAMMFSGMVRYLVLRKASELPPRCEIDDLMSCGLIALMESIDRWDPAKGAPLEQVAWTRVQGAILDELRRQDWAPRSVRRNERTLGRAEDTFVRTNGRKPSAGELADATGMTETEVLSARFDIDRAAVGSLNATVRRFNGDTQERIETIPDETGDDRPDFAAERAAAHALLRKAVSELPAREREVAELIYDRGLSQREASAVLGLTESRISQIHTRLRGALRLALAGQHEAFDVAV